MTIGEKIVELRKKNKMSQEKLANKLEITRQTLSNYENDITHPDLNQAKKISEVFSISLDELIDNNETLSSRVANTERLAKRQMKYFKMSFILCCMIIILVSIIVIVYYIFKKDYVSNSFMGFVCYKNNHHQEFYTDEYDFPITVLVNGKEETKTMKAYYIRTCEYSVGDEECLNDISNGGIMYGGQTIKEVSDSLDVIKNIFINNGYKCVKSNRTSIG